VAFGKEVWKVIVAFGKEIWKVTEAFGNEAWVGIVWGTRMGWSATHMMSDILSCYYLALLRRCITTVFDTQ
jgi:hypothetical protein